MRLDVSRLLFVLVTALLVPISASAQTCGTSVCTESESCLAGDGFIVDDEILLCHYFMGSFPVGKAALENFGGFPAGTQVHIEGCAVPYFGLCPLQWSIRDNTIESLTLNVPSLGRLGRALAVLSLLGLGSFAVWRFQNQHP